MAPVRRVRSRRGLLGYNEVEANKWSALAARVARTGWVRGKEHIMTTM